MTNGIQHKSADSGMEEVSLTVDGWLPNKSEAKSLFSKDHPESGRVLNLLRGGC